MIAVVILLGLAGIFKMSHDLSEENKHPFGVWWNKGSSWIFKYENNIPDWLDNGMLVFLTDWFHLSSFLHTMCYQLTIVMLLNNVYNFGFWKGVLIFVLLKGGIGAIGELTRRVINKAK